VVTVRIADLCPRVCLPNPWTPHNLNALAPQVIRRLLHVVDFERDHAAAEMLLLRSRIDRSALVSNQLDDGASQVQVHEIDRHAQTGLLDPISEFHREPENLGIECHGSIELVRDDLDVVDPLEHCLLLRCEANRYSVLWGTEDTPMYGIEPHRVRAGYTRSS
jgi:hypothetical protein